MISGDWWWLMVANGDLQKLRWQDVVPQVEGAHESKEDPHLALRHWIDGRSWHGRLEYDWGSP